MRPAIFGRRRVDEFAQAVTDPHVSSTTEHDPTAVAAPSGGTPELRVIQALSERVDDFAPRPDSQFRQQLRATLIAAAAEKGIGATAAALEEPTTVLPLGLVKADPTRSGRLRKSRRVRRTRAAVIVGLAAGTLAISGISVASGSAGPGDTLYSVKLSGEDARLALAGSDRDRGVLYLQFARNRMGEAMGTDSAGALSDLFTAMDEDTKHATALFTAAALSQHDAALLAPLSQFVDQQRADLATLASQRTAAQSVDLINRVGARVDKVRDAIACRAAFADTGDALGPTVCPCP